MRTLTLALTLFYALSLHCLPSCFGDARWIALESDSTILFPHIHLLKRKSAEGQSLKRYALPVFHKQVSLCGQPVVKATAYICGLGHYELFVDGSKAGGHFLDPGWTMYDKRLLYNMHDVTPLFGGSRPATASIEVMLGGGMYDIPLSGYHKFAGSCGAPKLLFALHVEYADGSRQTVVSDSTWTASESRVRYSSIYGGETCDATFEAEARAAVVTHPHWDVPLTLQDDCTRLRVKSEMPMSRISGGGDSAVYDSRQNCSGIVRLRVRGRRGSTVTLRPSEILKDGKIYQRCAPGYAWTYTLRGDAGGETWQPQFTYTGFRYVEATATGGAEIVQLTALHTSADVAETGSFECSDTLLNSIYTLIDWAISSNLASITTDCPTREKLGWQEQNHLMAASMMYRYDMEALMRKIADDMADSQHDDGAIPTTAPEYTLFQKGSGFEDTPEWGAAFILCPYYSYLWYGDEHTVRKHYAAMKRYMSYLESRSSGGILDYGLGDWFDVGPERPGKAQLTSVALSATAMYHYELCVMQQMAALTGHAADAETFASMAATVKKAFNDRFWNADSAHYENGSQTAQAMALCLGLTTDATRRQTLDALAGDIAMRIDGGGPTVTAGDVGYRYVLQALRDGRRDDMVWQMNRRDDTPGYAYQLRQGATALTESWQAYDNASNNHLMLGHLMEWLFQAPGGIRQAEGSTAWRHIVIDPQMVGELTWAKTSLLTPKGRIDCHWTASADRSRWTVDITVPQGADAEVHLPDGSMKHVGEGRHSYKK